PPRGAAHPALGAALHPRHALHPRRALPPRRHRRARRSRGSPAHHHGRRPRPPRGDDVTEAADLTGRRALVTGAASGIGEAVARELAARGASVVIADLDGEAATRLADELGGEAWAVDLSDLDALADRAVTADILVNNAGIQTV